MNENLFPGEIIDSSADANFHKHSVKTRIIYTATVLFVIASLAVLPFIHVDVSVRSQGVIKPVAERNQLTTLVSGRINKLYIRENETILKGEKVAEVAAPLLQEKLQFNERRQKKVRRYLKDLFVLQRTDSASALKPADLTTAKYRRSLLQFLQQVRNVDQKINNAQRKRERDRQLYSRQMLSDVEYEQTVYELQSVQNEYHLILEQQLNDWQAEKIAYQDELEQLQTENEQLREEQHQYVIHAPISGTILNMQGLYEGSFVSPNQTLAEISPDTGLIAESYIPPKDIGLIKEGMEVRLQVTAYDYNRWGIISGNVHEISNDITVVNNQPVFIVKCTLDQNYLELKNGYRGNLKKGMTIQARFTIARRSLFNMLYDNIDDWLNPNWNDQKRT